MGDQIVNHIDNVAEDILKIYNIAVEYGNENNKNPQLYTELMANLCKVETEFKDKCAAINKLSNKIDTTDRLEIEFDKALKKIKPSNHLQSARYKDFLEIFNANLEETSTREAIDDDIEMDNDTIVMIDPFTKQKLKDPVRNKLCNHVYEKASVLSLLKTNAILKCPMSGCRNKKTLIMADLKDDHILKNKLQAMTLNE